MYRVEFRYPCHAKLRWASAVGLGRPVSKMPAPKRRSQSRDALPTPSFSADSLYRSAAIHLNRAIGSLGSPQSNAALADFDRPQHRREIYNPRCVRICCVYIRTPSVWLFMGAVYVCAHSPACTSCIEAHR